MTNSTFPDVPERKGPQQDDFELQEAIQLWKEGNGDGFAEIYRSCFAPVREIVRAKISRKLKAMAGSMDVVQDVFLKLLKVQPPKGIQNRDELIFYLSAAVSNQLIQRHRFFSAGKRDQAKLKSLSQEPGLSGLRHAEPTPSQQCMGKEQYERMMAAVRELSDRRREAFILGRLLSVSAEEAAEKMGLSNAASFRALLAKALAQVTVAMEKKEVSNDE